MTLGTPAITSSSWRHAFPRRRGTALFFLAAFLVLLAVDLFGIIHHRSIFADVWTAEGGRRFEIFSAAYVLVCGVVFLRAAARVHQIFIVVCAALAVGSVGMAGPAASALFLLSSTVVGRVVVFRLSRSTLSDPLDLVLSTLCGASLYMTAIGLTAMLPIHYAMVHLLALLLPLVVWRSDLKGVLLSLRSLLRAHAWNGVWDYAAFCLAAFIPLVHLVSVLEPQVNNDAVVVHLAVPSIVSIFHEWPFDFKSYVYALEAMGAPWMMTPAYMLGGEYGARIINFEFFLFTECLLFLFARQFVGVGTAWLMVAIYGSAPFLQLETGNVFAEEIWIALLFGSAAALVAFRQTRDARYFVGVCILASASLSVKILGAPIAGLIFGLALLLNGRRYGLALLGVLTAGIISLYSCVYSYVLTGNPIYPFLNTIFKSPYYPAVPFTGLGRTSIPDLYHLTFATAPFADGGARDGSLGFAYLVLLPLALLPIGRRYPFIGWVSVVAVVILPLVEVRLLEFNLRYISAALPFAMIAITITYARAREISRAVWAAMLLFGFGVSVLNVYAMPVSGWAYRDFDLGAVVSREGVEHRRDAGAPERRVIDYLNLTRGKNVRVAFLSRPMLVDLQGDGVFTNWYNVAVNRDLSNAKTPGDVYHVMLQYHITKFIAFRPESGIINLTPAVDEFLKEYTQEEFTVGDVDLAQFKSEYQFDNDVIKNGSFASGLDGWTKVGTGAVADGDGISVDENGGVIQHVPIDDRLRYRYAMAAACPDQGSRIRMQLNWKDADGHDLGAALTAMNCGVEGQTYAEQVVPPTGARSADVLLLGLDAHRSTQISTVSLDW